MKAQDLEKTFKLTIGASEISADGVVLQEDAKGIDHPVCSFSKKFEKPQKNYSTIEKEILALILSFQQF